MRPCSSFASSCWSAAPRIFVRVGAGPGVRRYPSKVIRIIVPFPAGQATDILARVLADQLSKSLGQAVIVENKPGAGGTLGADAGAKSAPDGTHW